MLPTLVEITLWLLGWGKMREGKDLVTAEQICPVPRLEICLLKNRFIFPVLPRPVSNGGRDLSVLVFSHSCSESFVTRAALLSFAGSAVPDRTVNIIPLRRGEGLRSPGATDARQVWLHPPGSDGQPHAAVSLAQPVPNLLIE